MACESGCIARRGAHVVKAAVIELAGTLSQSEQDCSCCLASMSSMSTMSRSYSSKLSEKDEVLVHWRKLRRVVWSHRVTNLTKLKRAVDIAEKEAAKVEMPCLQTRPSEYLTQTLCGTT
eukprot:4105535-Amphidinium_carterae.1